MELHVEARMKLTIIPFLLAKFYECRSFKTGDGLLEELARNVNENVRCFSTDSWVTTPKGKKRMDQIRVGDFVLTANQTNVRLFVKAERARQNFRMNLLYISPFLKR